MNDQPTPLGDMTDEELAPLLVAWYQGRKIQWRGDEWFDCFADPHDWEANLAYRVAPEPIVPPSIDWAHVAPRFNYLVRHENGNAWLYGGRPYASHFGWIADGELTLTDAKSFASYTPGNCPWDKSLVIRPGHEEGAE